jgi:hypothetical protein
VYALAPQDLSASEANRIFNEFIGDLSLPLAVFQDHFIGEKGGVAVFFLDNPEDHADLSNSAWLDGWRVEVRPLIFSRSPAAFDEQIAFTLNAYRNSNWEKLQREQRPQYGDPRKEAETASEE